MERKDTIKEYVGIRGGTGSLSEEEKRALVEMSRRDAAMASLDVFKGAGVKPPVDKIDVKRAVADLKRYSKGGRISIPVMAWLIRKYAGLPDKVPMKPTAATLG